MTAIDTPMADMTNIRVIHPPVTSEGARRLLGALREAHAEGKALGSRAPHIRALCLSLETLLAPLRSSSAPLMSGIDDHKICMDNLRREMNTMIVQVERLIAIVRPPEA